MGKFICVELSECRNPADDRPLGKSGDFLKGSYSQLDIAEFPTAMAAQEAAQRSGNRRANSNLWISGTRAKAMAA